MASERKQKRALIRRQSITELPESGGFDWAARAQFIRLIAEEVIPGG